MLSCKQALTSRRLGTPPYTSPHQPPPTLSGTPTDPAIVPEGEAASWFGFMVHVLNCVTELSYSCYCEEELNCEGSSANVPILGQY